MRIVEEKGGGLQFGIGLGFCFGLGWGFTGRVAGFGSCCAELPFGERIYIVSLAIVEDDEIRLVQPGDRLVTAIAHKDAHLDQTSFDGDCEGRVVIRSRLDANFTGLFGAANMIVKKKDGGKKEYLPNAYVSSLQRRRTTARFAKQS
jgi:hypothetical protein